MAQKGESVALVLEVVDGDETMILEAKDLVVSDGKEDAEGGGETWVI